MKATVYQILATVALLVSACASSAQAECYGDAADMYGCGSAAATASKKASRQGSLEHFGDTSDPVLPDIANPQDQTASDVITPQERRRMLRSIVMGNSRRTLSERSFIQTMNQSGRPIRRSGAVNQGGSGR